VRDYLDWRYSGNNALSSGFVLLPSWVLALRSERKSPATVKVYGDRRDEAIVRLMAETGMRAGEVCGLTVTDIDLTRGLVTVRRGKGGNGRVVPFGPQTGVTIDRYTRSTAADRAAAEARGLNLGEL
jgi:integrase